MPVRKTRPRSREYLSSRVTSRSSAGAFIVAPQANGMTWVDMLCPVAGSRLGGVSAAARLCPAPQSDSTRRAVAAARAPLEFERFPHLLIPLGGPDAGVRDPARLVEGARHVKRQ